MTWKHLNKFNKTCLDENLARLIATLTVIERIIYIKKNGRINVDTDT